MNEYEYSVISTCIEALKIDGIDSKSIVRHTLQNLLNISNLTFNVDKGFSSERLIIELGTLKETIISKK